jgi:dihydrofolate reductase/thymidylate synthase
MSTAQHAGKIAMTAPASASSSPTLSAPPLLRPFSLVVAVDDTLGIGKDGAIPWNSPADRAFFKALTLGKPAAAATNAPGAAVAPIKAAPLNAVIMGVKTYLGIPPKFRPLPGRINVVLSRDPARPFRAEEEGVVVLQCDLKECLRRIADPSNPAGLPCVPERVIVVGGSREYAEALFDATLRPSLQTLYLTRVSGDFGCTTHIGVPAAAPGAAARHDIAHGLELESRKLEKDGDLTITYETYNLPNREERQYLDLCRTIIESGAVKGDRTGTGTISIFGAQMRFSLRDGAFPLLTTKRVFYRGVLEELLWFLRGDTNADHLASKGVHIWDANGSRAFLDSRGLTKNRVGDLGPVYGFQWRHFGAEYTDCDADYTGKGYDQVRQVIETLRSDPNDRRMIISAWNPAALQDMALPPCHMLAQFYVNDKRELSCMLYQRSCDMGLGVPFNIASYALLTAIIAKATGLALGDFVHTLGDAHVYTNHVDALKQQLDRTPRAFPRLLIKGDREYVEDLVAEDFELLDYRPHPSIKMDMAV